MYASASFFIGLATLEQYTVESYQNESFIKMRAAYLLSPSFITQGRIGTSKAALILMKNSHFDLTLQYQECTQELKRILGPFLFVYSAEFEKKGLMI